MRTNIEINDKLMAMAMQASGKRTKKETVEEALELLVRLNAQEALRSLRGKIEWEGDLDAMRRDK
ncbi:type II toxin-antitoxin system VapB family antitoxin [Mesorhizobium sp. CN2-181]|uniref:type II toxin-antitoxin system VapB family antitoxin n=1 Tax=Mesorhizobium yinganensis TaxID=3157707 RepID=UPI0032B858F5